LLERRPIAPRSYYFNINQTGLVAGTRSERVLCPVPVSRCNTSSNPWTGGTYSWQLSTIIYCPTRVFCAHFVLTHAHPRKLPSQSPIPNCSKPSTFNLEVILRYASEKEVAPYWYEYSINSIKPWARISHPRGQDITVHPP
jgi:hypothetical protein